MDQAGADAAAAASELTRLSERLADPATYADPVLVRDLVERHNLLRDRVDRLAAERDRLAAELDAADADVAPASAGKR